jgi:hypothetical protein
MKAAQRGGHTEPMTSVILSRQAKDPQRPERSPFLDRMKSFAS